MEPGHKPEKDNISWVWWHTPERVRQRDGEFEASLDFMIKLCLKKKKASCSSFSLSIWQVEAGESL